MKRLTPYLLTAAVGLSVGGGASAAGSLVTGNQVKDRSLHARDFSPRARRVLRGTRGPRGAVGERGVRGFPGPYGPVAAPSYGPIHTATLVAAGPVGSSGVQYLTIGGRGSTTTESDSQLVLPMFGYPIAMRARVAQASSGSRVVRLRFNESDALQTFTGPIEYACSIPAGALTCQSGPVDAPGTVSAGDRVAVQVRSSSSNPTDASVVFEIRS